MKRTTSYAVMALTIAAGAIPTSSAAGEYDEIYTAAWPAGATLAHRLPAGAYIADGLIAHFDGISNVGVDQPHDSAARTWKNLVSGGPDAKFYFKNAVSANGSWNSSGTGFVFNDNVCARLDSPGVALGSYPTVQLATDIAIDQQGHAWEAGKSYKCVFHSGVNSGTYNDNPSLFLDLTQRGNTSLAHILKLKADTFADSNNSASPRPTLTVPDQFQYVTFMLGSARNYMFDGTAPGAGFSRNVTKDYGEIQFSWGGVPYDEYRMMKGTYYSVRIYNRNLADDELAWNRRLDDIRFRGQITSGGVVVASNYENAHGAEANGTYYVNGHHTFTAPTSVMVDGTECALLGYALERWNPVTGAWEMEGTYEGTSFAYTNCAANTGARITWQWDVDGEISTAALPAGATLARTLPAVMYVADGLVGHFDGLNNAGLDQPHDSEATTWKNLVSGQPDADFTHRSNSPSPGHWTDNSYYFNNGTMASTKGTMNLGENFTVQIAINASPEGQTAATTSDGKTNKYHAWYNDNPKENRGFWTLSDSSAANGKTMVGNFNLFSGENHRINLADWEGKYLTWMLDGDNSRGYTFQTARRDAGMSCPVTTPNKAMKQCWGGEITSSGVLQAFLRGDYHSVRIYTKVLSDDELAWNRFFDEVRFRDAVTHAAVVVASNVDGVDGTEPCGTYYVNGHHEFTAPATTNVNGYTYELTGFTLETYDRKTGAWVPEDELREGMSFAYTNCLANTGARITWQWVSGNKPVAASYTGGGSDPLDFADPANWICVNAYGDVLADAVPISDTAVTVSGATPLQVTNSAVMFACRSVRLDNIALQGDADLRGLDFSRVTDDSTIDLRGHALHIAGTSVGRLEIIDTSFGEPGELHWEIASGTFSNSKTTLSGNLKFVKEGAGTFVGAMQQSYIGGTEIAVGTAQPPDGTGSNTTYCWDQFKAFSNGEIVVAPGARFDLRANYAYRRFIVLAGGTLTNTKANMTQSSYGGSGIGRLMADSTLDVANTIVFGDSNQDGHTDLGGYTLTAAIASGKTLYMRNAYVTNGTFAVSGAGTLVIGGKDGDALNMGNATLEAACAMNVPCPILAVLNYTSRYASAGNAGSAALNVFGTFRPEATGFYGPTMQHGSTLDLSAWNGDEWGWPVYSRCTNEGGNLLKFAPGATVTMTMTPEEAMILSGVRNDDGTKGTYLLKWGTETGTQTEMPEEGVSFLLDSRLGRKFRLMPDETGLLLQFEMGTQLLLR